MKDLIERLRKGWIPKAKRWSGDTHAEFSSGEVDVDATDALMKEAADAIEKLEADLIHHRELLVTHLSVIDPLRAENAALKAELAALLEQKPVLRVFLGTRGIEVTKDYGVMRFGEEIDVYAAPGAKP